MFKITSLTLLTVIAAIVHGETGHDAWLRYTSVPTDQRHKYSEVPEVVVTPIEGQVIESCVAELTRGLSGLLSLNVKREKIVSNQSSIVLSTIKTIGDLISAEDIPKDLKSDGYHIRSVQRNNVLHIVIVSPTEAGLLYGTFALLRKIALYQEVDGLKETNNPVIPLRVANEWDNLDGTIERGFAGPSIFYANNNVLSDLTRVEGYARLLASIGINGCSVNNVNANIRVITPEFLPQIQRLAKIFSRYAIRIILAIDLSSPQKLGHLDSYDPLDAEVIDFWNNKTTEIYKYVPDLLGYVMKADSEGRAGPKKYNRTVSETANTLARALKPHNGVLFYRAFVYFYPYDFKNLTADRAKAAYDIFSPFDGQFDDNVIVQIKHGPLDFQIREAVSPLFGALRKTNVAVEVEVTQEYLGRQRHVVFTPIMWKSVLQFDLRVDNKTSMVKDIASGKHFSRPLGGMVGVVNVGQSENWMANDLSMANMYGFAKLMWNPDSDLEAVVDEWTRLTFGHNPKVVEVIKQIQLNSYEAFENYTGPLGVGTLTDLPDSKYGPNVLSCENNGWGQWIRVDHKGVGMERSVASLETKNGTGYIGQYSYEVAKMYENLADCPDSLVLAMHHVSYDHVLHSGKTLIQHIYDSHYAGSQTARQFHKSWKQVKGLIDDQRYEFLDRKLHYQWSHSEVWRDSISQFFNKMSGIADKNDRIYRNIGRIEAEDMTLEGYINQTVDPWETASGGFAVQCLEKKCSAETTFDGQTGAYDLSVQYFDETDGISQFKLFVSEKLISEWKANDTLPNTRPCGDTSTRFTAVGVPLEKGYAIKIEAVPDQKEQAVLDYIQIEKSD